LRDQIDREMQVDIVPFRQPRRFPDRVAGTLELFRAPLLDPVELGVQMKLSFRRSHTQRFGRRRLSVVPFPGGSDQTEVQLVRLQSMLARVARYEVPPDRCDEAVEAFLDSAKEIASMDGFQNGYVFVDSETGETMTVVFWQNNAAAEASATHAATARRRAVSAVDGEVQSVQAFDVVREFGGA
jgi:heme-degrading monooxygenase HmoA